jgi:hypothetical protein
MMKINPGYKVHATLPSRLDELTRQSSFYQSPSLCWATRNMHNSKILERLRAIAPAYGVRDIISADEVSDQKIDAVFGNFGCGGLPYLAFDKIITADDGPIFIDTVDMNGESLGTWGNVFALSYSRLTGEKNTGKILAEYIRCCFGGPADEISKIFTLARTAIEKSFYVLVCVPMMDKSHWPVDIAWLDEAVEKWTPVDHPLRRPTLKTISDVDFEKIEALESVHEAWRIFESISKGMDVNSFLWLEHYLLHLKTVCQALRILAVGYFRFRANQLGTVKIPGHIFRAMRKDLFDVICDHRAVISQFERDADLEGIPLAGILTALNVSG